METPREVAWSFHETLLEVLRRLNQASERRTEVDGMEYHELERTLSRSEALAIRPGKLPQALQVLMENRLVAEECVPAFAWDRQRTIGERFRITPEGKAYLLRQLEENGRIR